MPKKSDKKNDEKCSVDEEVRRLRQMALAALKEIATDATQSSFDRISAATQILIYAPELLR